MNRAKTSYAYAVGLVLMCASMVASAVTGLPDFREIVKDNSPAVVKIIVTQSPGYGRHPQMQEIPDYLRKFFERRAPQQPQQQRPMAVGSGFILSDNGYVVTNNHVVEGAEEVSIRLADRREFDAEVVGTDPRSDLALLKVDGDDLPTLKLAEPNKLDVGEWVLAIGSPFGLDYSVTAGIVSAMGRSLPTEQRENYVPFIQTDVAINPGNSGGPLFNLDGEVVGVNSQIYTRSGGSIGLSFSIPVNVVINVVEQLKEHGAVTRGWLGVSIQDVDVNLAESLGLDRPMGALVAQLTKDGPADKGGIEPGDVIVRFDGADIDTSAALPHVVGLVTPGSRVDVDVVRNGKTKSLKVKVGGLEADQSLQVGGRADTAAGEDRLGLVVAEASPQELENNGVSAGVTVRSVRPDSPAARAGIQPGDVITLVGQEPVKSTEAYGRVVDGLEPGSPVALRLIRGGAPRFLGLRLDG